MHRMDNLSLHSKFGIWIEEMHDKYLGVDVVAKQQESFLSFNTSFSLQLPEHLLALELGFSLQFIKLTTKV